MKAPDERVKRKQKVRLIDANALKREIQKKKVVYYSVHGFNDLIDRQPTIVVGSDTRGRANEKTN